MKTKIALMLLLSLASHSTLAKELYRAPSAGDQGAYYVLSSESLDNGQFKVMTSRVGKKNDYTDFTELKIDCAKRQYFTLAESSLEGKHDKPTGPLRDWSASSKWTVLFPGSSKSDLVNFICK